METIKYIILGILQGITEPLPISSSGHVIVFKNILGGSFINDLNFEIIINFGSLIAVLFYFRNDLLKIITDFLNYLKTKNKQYYQNYRLAWLLVLSTIPAGIIGLLFKEIIESHLSNVKLIGFALLITGFFLYLIKDLKGKKNENNITWFTALIIGLGQAIAILPGISRSGATIVSGMFCDLKREVAFKYSFLLYIPISFATLILGIKDFTSDSQFTSLIMPYFLSMIAATIFTYYALKWFQQIIKQGKLIYFVYYCLLFGLFIILYF